MNTLDKAMSLLDHDVMLRLLYETSSNLIMYAIVCKHSFYSFLKGSTNTVAEYFDVLREQKFCLPESSKVIGFDCFKLPQGTSLNDISNNSNSFKLRNNQEYINQLIATIDTLKADFISNLIYHLEDYHHNNGDTVNELLTIRFYPNSVGASTFEETLKLAKDSIIYNYHIFTELGHSIVPALKRLGATTNLIIDETSPPIITAIRKQWLNIIYKERDIMLKNIQTLAQEYKLQQPADTDYIEQFEDFKKLLINLDVSPIHTCSTIKQIISFWPAIMQPQPPFVYGN